MVPEGNGLRRKTAWLPIVLCWLVYTAAYMGRYSYNSNITPIMEAFGINHADAGLVTTFFFFAYGVGQIVNGLLCKYYNKRFIITFSLIMSSILNLAVFFGVPFYCIKYMWLVNGALQSTLWPILICVISENLKAEDLSKSIVAMSTTATAGTFITYGASAIFSVFDSYSYSFLLGAAVMTAVAAIWFLLYKRAFRGEGIQDENKAADTKKPHDSKNKVCVSFVIMIVVIGIFAVANNLVKDGLTTWVPAILKENFNLPGSLSIFLTLFLPVLGCFAAVMNAAAEKKIKSFIFLLCIWCTIAAVCIVIVILFIKTPYLQIILLLFGLISLFMYGVNNIITNRVPIYTRDKINSGLLAGILNGCCYAGSTISSYGLGHAADSFGWNGVFILLLAVCCLPVLISCVMYIFNRIKKIDML